VAALAAAAGGCGHGPDPRRYRIDCDYGVEDPQFRRTVGGLLGPPLVEGNATATLLNGDRIFPAMLDAIHSARRSVTFETFVYWSGRTGGEFASALADAAARGVKVHVIIDSVGSDRIDHRHVRRMTDAGAHVVMYHPLHWYDLTSASRLNNRTHRKLLVVDGAVGFIGGAGVADQWLGDAEGPKHWRDTHFLVRWPVVAQLQAAFADNWMESTGRVLHGDDYFPGLRIEGSQAAQVFRSAPGAGGTESMRLMYLLSLAAARHDVRLATAYFVPDEQTVAALLGARRRGVRVRVIVPGRHIDVKPVRHASRAGWGGLLRAGVEVYEYGPTMYHCKLMIVDDLWVSVGSANLDNLSLRMNDEANLNVLDRAFAAEQTEVFERDLARCRRVTYEQWRRRPAGAKLLDQLATPFRGVM